MEIYGAKHFDNMTAVVKQSICDTLHHTNIKILMICPSISETLYRLYLLQYLDIQYGDYDEYNR